MEMLTPTEGVDFSDYLHRVYITVKRNWFSVMPESVQLGDKGVVSLQFQIMKNGVVPDGEPLAVRIRKRAAGSRGDFFDSRFQSVRATAVGIQRAVHRAAIYVLL